MSTIFSRITIAWPRSADLKTFCLLIVELLCNPKTILVAMQAASVEELLRQLRGILGDHCGFWVDFHPLQAARGLVATPYPLCAMLMGVHLGASSPESLFDSSSTLPFATLVCLRAVFMGTSLVTKSVLVSHAHA